MSADDAVTTLAMRLEELAAEVDEARQQRDRDRQDVAAAKTAVAQWNARLTQEGIGPTLAMRRDIKNLAERVDALAATLGTALDQGKQKAPHGPRWDNLDQDQEAAQLARLREWVDGVLRVQYPGYKLPDCWANHREALWNSAPSTPNGSAFSATRAASTWKTCFGSTSGGYPEHSGASTRQSRARTSAVPSTATLPPGEGRRAGNLTARASGSRRNVERTGHERQLAVTVRCRCRVEPLLDQGGASRRRAGRAPQINSAHPEDRRSARVSRLSRARWP